MRNTLLFVVVASVLGAGACFAQDVKPDDSTPQASEEEFSLDKMMAELNEPESEKEKSGTDLLDEALALRLTANTLKDIESILELSQKAIEKGLSADEEKVAQRLIRSTLLQRAAVTADILRDGRAESVREIAIIAKIGLDDLEQVKKTFDPKETENDFEGANVYWYIKATLLVFSGQDGKNVIEIIKTAKKLNQDNNARMAQLLYMESSVKTTDPKEQLKLLKQAYEKDSQSEDIERSYIIALARNDKIDDAAKLILSKAEKDELKDTLFILILSEYYQNQKQPEKAMEWLNKVPKPAADSIQIVKAKFFCALEMEDKKQIMDLSLKLLNDDPQNIDLRKLRVRIAIAEKKYDVALEEVRLALFFDENSKELQMMKMAILCEKDKANFDEARKAIEDLLNEKEPDFAALNYAGVVAHLMKDFDLKLRIFQIILKQDENNEDAVCELPSIYIALKQYDKAVEAFEKSVKLYPENPTALNNYSWFLSTTDQDAFRDGKKALDLALKAAQASNYEKAYILSTLAAAYAENGDFENALKYIQKALEINKDESIAQSIKNEMESYKQNKPIREDSNEWFK